MRDEFCGKLREDLWPAGERAETSSDHNATGVPGFAVFGSNAKAGAIARDALNFAIFQGRKGLLSKPQSILNESIQWNWDRYFVFLRRVKSVNAKSLARI